MKQCMICGAVCAADNQTCPACGEASFASAGIEPKEQAPIERELPPVLTAPPSEQSEPTQPTKRRRGRRASE